MDAHRATEAEDRLQRPRANAPVLLAVADDSLSLCWSAAASPDGMSPDTAAYQLQMLPAGGADWLTLVEACRESRYTMRGLTPGKRPLGVRRDLISGVGRVWGFGASLGCRAAREGSDRNPTGTRQEPDRNPTGTRQCPERVPGERRRGAKRSFRGTVRGILAVGCQADAPPLLSGRVAQARPTCCACERKACMAPGALTARPLSSTRPARGPRTPRRPARREGAPSACSQRLLACRARTAARWRRAWRTCGGRSR